MYTRVHAFYMGKYDLSWFNKELLKPMNYSNSTSFTYKSIVEDEVVSSKSIRYN